MLNYFYWYGIITSLIFGLYIIPLSSINSSLKIPFLIVVLISIILSFILGKIFNKYFEFKSAEFKKSKYSYIPMAIIAFLFVVELIYTREIPLISVTLKHISDYQEYKSIPFLHMFLAMLCMYYSVKYIYHAISHKEERRKNILCYVIINIIMLLYNMRSFFMISIFILLNLIVAKFKTDGKKISFKYIISIVVIIITILYLFGGFGNMRQGYKFKDSSFIEKIGRYEKWPAFIPKQYMWAYSYITSPLANLNYNISINNNTFNVSGYMYEYLPTSITKRLKNYDNANECKLIRTAFTVSTGYCDAYANSNIAGMCIFWLITMMFPAIFFKFRDNDIKAEKYFVYLLLTNACISFMFFSNMFAYGGTAPALWFSIFTLINNKKIVIRNIKE